MSEAQMMPMLTSTTDQMTAWMPDSGRELVLVWVVLCVVWGVCVGVTYRKVDRNSLGSSRLRVLLR
jgi:hypothetical protein